MSLSIKSDQPQDEIGALRNENAHLLDELAMAYQQMEKVLALADRETKIAYSELRKRNELLQVQLVELQTAHEELRDAQHLLLRAERMSAMGQMAATIVHEINNPLAVIVGRLELILLSKEEMVEASEVELIADAARRLGRLTKDILRFSRRDFSEFSSVDLNKTVAETLEFLQPLIRQVKKETAFAVDLPKVRANPAQIEQVLTNFLTNATDALSETRFGRIQITTGTSFIPAMMDEDRSAERQVYLTIGRSKTSSEDEHVYLEVTDNGPGVDSAKLKSIFDPFFSTKSEDGGTGLGLAISRKIAEDHNGDILVATKAGAGSSFRLLLPLERTSHAQVS